MVKTSNKTQPKTRNPILRTGGPVLVEQPSGSNAQEINKRVLFDCQSNHVRKGRPVNSCVPVSVARLDQDKDADENVDADQVRTERPVEREQSIGLFTQREEIDIDLRVSGLPQAIVKQAKNFRVRELVKKIESHPHRRALEADLQRNNAYNPFSDNSKAMIREMGNVELFELCETIPKVQCSECLVYWNQGIVYCTCGHLLKESEASQNFSPMATGCFLNPELRHQEGATSWCSARQNCGTERAFHCPQCSEEMNQKETLNSRSFPTRSNIS